MVEDPSAEINGYLALALLSQKLGETLTDCAEEHMAAIERTLLEWWKSDNTWAAEEALAEVVTAELRNRGELDRKSDEGLAVPQLVRIPANLWLRLREEAEEKETSVSQVVVARLKTES